MLKYVSKFILDILPSLVATVIGAYIVNHYIVAKPAADVPVTAAVSTVLPKVEAKTEVKTDAKASENSPPADTAAIKTKPPVEKAADRGVDGAIPGDARRHQPTPREKTATKVAPAIESTPNAEERRDANDLARAAIERLRGSSESTAHVQEAAHAAEPTHGASPAAVQALPPPILVSTPRTEPSISVTGSLKPTDQTALRAEDAHRPPAEIPSSRPLELHVEAIEPIAPRRTTVADDVFSAAKSVFHAVIPR